MNQLAQTIGSALLLEDEAFVKLRDAENSFARGLMTIVTISLIVGLVLSLVSFIGAVGTTPAEEMAQVQQGMEQALETMRQFGAFGGGPEAEAFWRIFMQNFQAGIEMGRDIGDVVVRTTPAPQPVVNFFEALGQWLSYPFGWISTWMFYGLVTLVFAKLLGGTATIREMLGTTSLVAVPHLLDAFGFIPFVGFLVGIVTFFWGLAIYVKGTAIANRFTLGRGLVAVLAPFILLFALIALVILIVLILAIAGN